MIGMSSDLIFILADSEVSLEEFLGRSSMMRQNSEERELERRECGRGIL